MQKSSFSGYSLAFTQQAEKDLKKIDKSEARRIKNKLEDLVAGTQNVDIKKLEATNEPTYRLRSGNYRIVFQVKRKIITILVISIAHRKQVYRRY